MSLPFDSKLLMSDGITSQEWRDILAIIGDQHLGVNLLGDPTFICWPQASDSSHQGYWHYDGIGTGTAARDTTSKKFDGMSSQIAYGDQAITMYQEVLSANAAMDPFEERYVSAGIWIRALAPCVLRINDGDDVSESDPHPGDDSWYWMTVSHQISTSATMLRFEVKTSEAGTIRSDGATLVFGPIPPPDYLPAIARYDTAAVQLHGDPVETGVHIHFDHTKPWVVKNVYVQALTAASGQALIVDLEQYDGAWRSIFSTRPQIATSAFWGNAEPDGTYRYRCFNPAGDVADADSPNYKSDSSHCRLSVDQAATGGGKNPTISVNTIRWHRPLDQFNEFNDD